MDTPAHPADQELAQLRVEFQGHRIWRSTRPDGRLGEWIATLHDPKAGVDPTIIRSSAQDLRGALIHEGDRAANRTVPEPEKWVRW